MIGCSANLVRVFAGASLLAVLLSAPVRGDEPTPIEVTEITVPDAGAVPEEGTPKDGAEAIPDDVRADRALLRHVEDDQPVAAIDKNFEEVNAYLYLLRLAHSVPPEVQNQYAARDVTFAHLFSEHRDEYRGALVHLRGRLKMIRKLAAPKMLHDEGITDLYEAWVFTNKLHAYPVCFLFTELPPGLKVGEDLNESVALNGYFFKRYKYRAADAVRLAPLLMGRTLQVTTPALGENVRLAFQFTFVPIVVMVVGSVAAAAGILTWIYRMGDRAVRARLGERKAPNPFETAN